jgi:hypothetical protein
MLSSADCTEWEKGSKDVDKEIWRVKDTNITNDKIE